MKFILPFIILFLFISCEKTDSNDNPDQSRVIVSNDLYTNAPDDGFQFVDVYIENDSLCATIQYGGGCGGATLLLIDSEALIVDDPHKRHLRFSLDDQDNCEALITKKFKFYLGPVQIPYYNTLELIIKDWETELIYNY